MLLRRRTKILLGNVKHWTRKLYLRFVGVPIKDKAEFDDDFTKHLRFLRKYDLIWIRKFPFSL